MAVEVGIGNSSIVRILKVIGSASKGRRWVESNIYVDQLQTGRIVFQTSDAALNTCSGGGGQSSERNQLN